MTKAEAKKKAAAAVKAEGNVRVLAAEETEAGSFCSPAEKFRQ